jgi:hypothetical protein
MLRSVAASKAAKLLGACVCPLVGAATVTMAVPKVRNAVHNATAPREYALPKSRVKPVEVVTPCVNVPQVAFANPLGGPLALNDIPNPLIPGGPAPPLPGPPFIIPPGGGSPGAPPEPPVTSIPEPSAWLQLIFGFALVGGSIRVAAGGLGQRDEDLVPSIKDV